MIGRFFKRTRALQNYLTATFGTDISTPRARRAAWWHFQLMDHAFLRVWWTNLYPVANGVWRSNQPSPARLRAMAGMGIRTILNLRGPSQQGFYLFEVETTRALGLTQIDIPLSAKRLPERDTLLTLVRHLEQAPRPMLMHCKSGSDRTGLASALYQAIVENRPVDEAFHQLDFRPYLHRRGGKAGVLDQMLRSYAKAAAEHPISLRDWIETVYDPVQIHKDYLAWKAGTWHGPL